MSNTIQLTFSQQPSTPNLFGLLFIPDSTNTIYTFTTSEPSIRLTALTLVLDSTNLISIVITGITLFNIYTQDSCFANLTNLTTFTLNGTAIILPNLDDTTYPSTNILSGCSRLTHVQLGQTTVIYDFWFTDCTSLTTLASTNSIISINKSAFAFTNVGSTIFTACFTNVTTIGDSAFKDCNNLTQVILPPLIETIGISVFFGCNNLTQIIFPPTSTIYTIIGDNTFSNISGLTSITIPNYITNIGTINGNSFGNCINLTSVFFQDNSQLTYIGQITFSRCTALTNIILPGSLQTIDFGAFSGCPIISIVIPNQITNISASLFNSCTSLQSVTLPNNLISIDSTAFGNCTALTNIILPLSLTTIGPLAFGGCTALTSLTIPQTVTTIDSTFLDYTNGITIITNSSLSPIVAIINNINTDLATHYLSSAITLIIRKITPRKNQYNVFVNGGVMKWFYRDWD